MLLDQDVFIVASDETFHGSDEVDNREFHVYDSEDDLREGLADLDIVVGDQIRVFHGVLAMAEALPSDLHDRNAYVVVAPNWTDDAFVVDAGITLEFLEETVTEIISKGIGGLHGLDIDDIYILYGYELSVTLSIDEDDFDEETLEGCRVLSAEAEEIRVNKEGLQEE
jgi:hypothetical protein